MSINAVDGPMFAGKTTHVGMMIARYIRGGKQAIMIRYGKDDRYRHLSKSGGIVTHAGYELPIPTQSVEKLADVVIPPGCIAIGIDEVQFYPDNIEFCDACSRAGIHIWAAGLGSDYNRKPFLRMPELFAIADTIVKLKAVCSCGEDAVFTKRLTLDTELEVIGGQDKYAAKCRKCYHLDL
jgi:thymidine kinase